MGVCGGGRGGDLCRCDKCLGVSVYVCVCVGLCAPVDPSALPLMCEGRH